MAATDDVTFTYTGVTPYTTTLNGNSDYVTAVQFTLQAQRGSNIVSNSMLYTYETPVFTDSNPYLSFADWYAQKLVPLLDSIVLTYKWKSDLRAKLDALDSAPTARPLSITGTTVAEVTAASTPPVAPAVIATPAASTSTTA
jgi:hypothetical protein